MNEDIDYSLISEQLLNELFPENDIGKCESVMSIVNCIKFNNIGLKYDHILIISTHALYLISKMKLKFKIMFGDLIAIIKSN
jgi:hypothetical protein